jgi:glycerol uptake facilitator-like aquaporin
MILIFEMFGTGMLTMLFLSAYNAMSLFIGFFVLLIFSARISGSHYNPIVTLAFMLRKDAGQFNRWLGILYMVAQVAGAMLGAMFAFYCFRQEQSILTLNEPYRVIQCMVSEAFGGFILVLVYLTQTEENYKLSDDAAITLMIISGAYVIALALSHPGFGLFGAIAINPLFSGSSWSLSPLNPAIALAEITFSTFAGNINEMHWSWIYLVFSWGGSLLAVLLFEFVFKKATNVVEKHDEEEELHEEQNEITQPMME